MAATKGNQWWKLRSKHGRDKIFKTPEILWEACAEYFEATDKRKWNKVDFKGPLNKRVKIPTETPYTYAGLCLFLGVHSKYFNDFRDALKDKTDDVSKEFSDVIARVDQIIYVQKFEGAAVGAFNHNIISRELGQADRLMIQGDPENPVEVNATITGMRLMP